VSARLEEFLPGPGPCVARTVRTNGNGRLTRLDACTAGTATPWSGARLAYIDVHGGDGLTRVAQLAC